jgi:transposase
MLQERSRADVAVMASAGSRTEPESELTDEQWFLIAKLFENPVPSVKGGRPRKSPRPCVEGVWWVLRTGARWKDLPKRFPSPATCWRRHQEWSQAGIWEEAWAMLLRKLDHRGRLNWQETVADGTFSSAKKGAVA